MRASLLLLALQVGSAGASAQSTIYGIDLLHHFLITSDTADFVGNYVQIAPNPLPIFALDFDASATTLWGVRQGTLEYGTIDLSTGAFTALGTVTGPTANVTGLTAAADGTTWYACEWNNPLSSAFLYVGDVTTGTFALVGLMGFDIFIDISIDSQGNLYAHNISDQSLYVTDTATGACSLIGPTGQNASFAQGMDFDWSDDTLYATILNVGGASVFAAFDLNTGEAVVLQDTTSMVVELEIAVKQPVPVPPGTAYCFGGGPGSTCPCGNSGDAGEGCANSTGSGCLLDGHGTPSASTDDLRFAADGLAPAQPALLFAGANAINGGQGIAFGDGLRCAGGGVVRLGVMAADTAGGASFGPGLIGLGGWSSGDTRRFQTWYRDPTGSPCGFGFNLSNGYEVTFTP